MRDIFGQHKQDFNEIRRLCLICHGLDLTTSSLSSENSRLVMSKNVEDTLHNLVSSNLLSLVIAIRVNLYQSTINQPNLELPNSSWLYFDDKLIEKPATLKQVCDKIIHADSFSKTVPPSELIDPKYKIAVQFKGVEYKKSWTLDVVLECFVEDVLSLLDSIEKSMPNKSINKGT
ncbi:hypothetical protein AT00_13420 [Pseudoalteromonas lipolytica SCSIO 04301]|uniref:hypothetical protein n=1 Tax=Pseudoalteromonas TaxID=53246 RepID=UPI000445EAA3|nr:hypothetical protein [Pseudoalteromonas lipolytica]EWH05749.1 hypothetical protein AT00_13420 [Pseudoalteromonas lipolytica SCSIO 04301]